MKSKLLLLAFATIAAAFPSCTKTFEASGLEERGGVFARAETVVGRRTVFGVEVPLTVVPRAVGFGVWSTSIKTEGEILAEEQEILRLARGSNK